MRERIKIDNTPVSEERFARCFWDIWDRLEAPPVPASHPESASTPRAIQGKPVYFHYLTLMALHCYMQEQVGTAVIECGIGGEYDTTNILVQPSATGITSLGIDHVALLGDSIDQIAWHKAGIFKKGVPAFTVEQPAEALSVLHQRAEEKQTVLYEVPLHTQLERIALGLHGHFQKLNASLAIAISALHLNRLGFSGIPDPYDSASVLPGEFIRGLTEARLGGRCDMRPDRKTPNVTWYIDGGHTIESIEVAGKWFASKTAKSDDRPSQRILLFNQQTRDASSLAIRLHDILSTALTESQPFKHAIFCTNTTYQDAGYKADLVSINTSKDDVDSLRVQHELAATWDRIDPTACVHVVRTIEEAVTRARELAASARTEVLATGSLHLVGGLIEVLESEAEGNSHPTS